MVILTAFSPEALAKMEADALAIDRHAEAALVDGDIATNTGSQLFFIATAQLRLGQLAFILRDDVREFRTRYRRSAEIGCVKMFEYHDRGAPINEEHLGSLQIDFVLSALGAGDLDLAKRCAENLSRVPEPSGKKYYAWKPAFANVLKAILLESKVRPDYVDELRAAAKSGDGKRRVALCEALIAAGQGADVSSEMKAMIIEWKRFSRGSGQYAKTLEASIASRPLGIVNLALHRGLKVPGLDLIPDALRTR